MSGRECSQSADPLSGDPPITPSCLSAGGRNVFFGGRPPMPPVHAPLFTPIHADVRASFDGKHASMNPPSPATSDKIDGAVLKIAGVVVLGAIMATLD